MSKAIKNNHVHLQRGRFFGIMNHFDGDSWGLKNYIQSCYYFFVVLCWLAKG